MTANDNERPYKNMPVSHLEAGAKMCAERLVRLIELNAPANVLRNELDILTKRVRELILRADGEST